MPEDVEMNDSAQPALAAAPAAADAPAPALSTLQHLQEIASVVEAGSLTKEVRRISRAVRPTVALRRRLAAPDVAAFLAFALPPSSEAFTRLSPLLPKEDGSEMDVDAAAPAAQVSIKHGLPEIEIYSQRQQLVSCEVFSEEKDGSVDGGGLKTKSCKRKIGIQVSPKEKTKKGREESSHKNLLQNLLVKKQQKYPVYRTRSEGEPDCKFWCIVEVHGQQFKSVNLHIRKKDAEQDAAKVAYDFLIARDGDSFEGVLALIDKGLLLGKTILYDFSCKKKICHPSYSCHRQEGPGRMTLFVTTVSVAGMEFTGVMAKSKNDAAERAACLAVKSILDTNDEDMLEIFRTKRRLLTAMPPSLLSACGLSVPAKHSPKKHKTNALGVSKDAYVEEPDEVQDNKRLRHEQFGRESTISGTSYQQPQTYMFQSSTVTYDSVGS